MAAFTAATRCRRLSPQRSGPCQRHSRPPAPPLPWCRPPCFPGSMAGAVEAELLRIIEAGQVWNLWPLYRETHDPRRPALQPCSHCSGQPSCPWRHLA